MLFTFLLRCLLVYYYCMFRGLVVQLQIKQARNVGASLKTEQSEKSEI